MKKLCLYVLMGLSLCATLPVLAAITLPDNLAVNIIIGSKTGVQDAAALRAIRQVVGYGIASGAVDSFTVYIPRTGVLVPAEGGKSALNACADAGFGANKAKFNAFIQDLNTIKVKKGVFYTVLPAANCPAPAEPVFCTQDVKLCPDGSAVGRVAPSCAFAPCPEPK
jgi:hypothetical protein